MDYFGYSGSVLFVDLTTGRIRREALDPEKARDFLGGFGLNCLLAYEALPPGIAPLSPQNVLVLGAGPLVGTLAPGAARVMATTKFPLTGAVASASGSMSLGAHLKWAGYDHLVITGRAKAPVYLRVQDEEVEVCDAALLWGRDIFQTTDALWERHGRGGVMAIGPAGENLVSFALSLVDKAATLGRGGLGAVMGSKNLKALFVRGTKGVRVARPRRFLKAVDGLYERVRRYPLHQTVVEQGIMSNWDNFARQMFSRKNWSEAYPPERATELFGPQKYERMIKTPLACPSCFICCKETLQLTEGEFAGLEHTCPSFLNVGLLGTRLGLDDYGRGMKLMSLLDRYGLCLMTFGSLVDFAIDLYERGLLSGKDTQEMELRRDFETLVELAERIAHRRGFGDVLAQGWEGALRRIGGGVDRHAHISKGQDFVWDPRMAGLGTMEFEQIVSLRGPTSATGGSPTYIPNQPLDRLRRQTERIVPSGEALERVFNSPLGFNVGRLTRYAEDWYSLVSSLGICNRAHNNRFYHLELCAELYSEATGIDMDPSELVRGAERAWNLYKLLNVREGFTRRDDALPEGWFEPMRAADGGRAPLTDYYKTKPLPREEVAALIDDYYDERGWDPKTGVPTRAKLLELGLGGVAQDLGI